MHSEFDRQVARFDISRLCAQVAEDVIEPTLGDRNAKYRCTVYVPDIVFKGALYRLLDYYPGGNGSGSVYSDRYGIIGRSWRLGEPLHEPTVPGDRKDLIEKWGMNREEAARQEDKSFATVLLREDREKPPVGLLYVESEGGVLADDLCARLESDPKVIALTEAVARLMAQMRGRGPSLELFQS